MAEDMDQRREATEAAVLAGVPDLPQNKKKEEKFVPTYKMVGHSKVPVSKAHGAVWHSRMRAAKQKRIRKETETAWDEAIKYYNHDQLGHRTTGQTADIAGNLGGADRINDVMVHTENVVFSNVAALVPVLYAKNPRAEFTSDSKPEQAALLEDLVNTLAWMRAAPGINLKPKARRCVVMTALTNKSYLEVGYNKKELSIEAGREQLERLAQKLEKAENPKEIREVEAELQALEKQLDVLNPAGAWVRFLRPHDVYIDPNSIEEDLSDAQWIMIREFMSTEYIKAVFAQESDDDSCTYKSIYEPSHVLGAGADPDRTLQAELESFEVMGETSSYAAHGYEDEESYRKAQHTEVLWVWDKTTRRVFLYNSRDWKWPLWVWDDPLQLDTFFPVEPLVFYTNPEGGDSKGEVTYYLDQQDAINEINNERRRARRWAHSKIIYDKDRINSKDLDQLFKSTGRSALGISIPEGKSAQDFVQSIIPPSLNYSQVFDTTPEFQAIQRMSSVKTVLQGAEFKTNTTNRAIQTYEATSATRLDEKVDAVEDMLGNVFWKIAQLCLMNMDAEMVGSILGKDVSGLWITMTPQEIRQSFRVRVVGGSTEKPTSQAKKREALEVAQIMGQFAGAAPQTAMMITLKLFEQAFDEIVIKDEDWQALRAEAEAMMKRGDSTGGADADTTQQEAGGDSVEAAIAAAVSRGVPEDEARAFVAQRLQQQGVA